jgi:SPP1 family phage portal protein
MGVVDVRDPDSDDWGKYVIYSYIARIEKGKKEVRRIQVWSETETTYFVQVGGGKVVPDESVKVNPRPHVVYTDKDGQKMGYPLGYIPFWRLDNCKKRVGGLNPIKGLIDDYDVMMCGLSNNLADFDTPLHVVKGFYGTDLTELQQNLKTMKIIGVDEKGGVETVTVTVPYEARQTKAQEDEKNIFRFGMGLDMNALKDTSATTNIAIKAAYSLLEMKANKMEQRLRRLLKDILKVVLAEINAEYKTDYQLSDVWFDFQRNIMANETENIQNEKTRAETKQIEVNTILNVAANVGDEQTLQAICDVMEWDFDAIQSALKKQAEEGLEGAQSALDAVVPEDDADVPEEDPAFPEE